MTDVYESGFWSGYKFESVIKFNLRTLKWNLKGITTFWFKRPRKPNPKVIVICPECDHLENVNATKFSVIYSVFGPLHCYCCPDRLHYFFTLFLKFLVATSILFIKTKQRGCHSGSTGHLLFDCDLYSSASRPRLFLALQISLCPYTPSLFLVVFFF